MVKFGIITQEQYLRLGDRERRLSGPHVAYNLLSVGEHPNAEQIRMFEDISFTLRTSNGTFRTTFRNRFDDANRAALQWIEKLYPKGFPLVVQDRAVSHGLTSKEFAEQIFALYPDASFEASDLLLGLVELAGDGESYIGETNGTLLQYIKAPFVVSLHHPEPWRYPWNRWVAEKARRRFRSLNVPSGWAQTQSVQFQLQGGTQLRARYIPYIHPEALALAGKNPNFCFRERSVFDTTPGAAHVVRTMNIFNRGYFSEQQLAEGVSAVFASLQPGGLWMVGRTLEEKFTNHVTFFRRNDKGWEVLERLGSGSEIEEIALRSNQ